MEDFIIEESHKIGYTDYCELKTTTSTEQGRELHITI